jgi:hypothetical protein
MYTHTHTHTHTHAHTHTHTHTHTQHIYTYIYIYIYRRIAGSGAPDLSVPHTHTLALLWHGAVAGEAGVGVASLACSPRRKKIKIKK